MNETDAIATIERIVARNCEIDRVKIFELRPNPPLQDRIELNHDEQQLVARALEIRSASGFPFWDSLMATAIESKSTPLRVIDQVLLHNRSDSGVRLVSSEEIERGCLRALCEAGDHAIAVGSRVTLTDGSHAHIGMVDFNCGVTESSTLLASAVASRIAASGFLLESGESFHFYSDDLVPEQGFPSFLARALLFSPVVDRAWIAHQLIEGEAALRISAHAKLGWAPRLVARIGHG